MACACHGQAHSWSVMTVSSRYPSLSIRATSSTEATTGSGDGLGSHCWLSDYLMYDPEPPRPRLYHLTTKLFALRQRLPVCQLFQDSGSRLSPCSANALRRICIVIVADFELTVTALTAVLTISNARHPCYWCGGIWLRRK